jgi:hypothetical protein
MGFHAPLNFVSQCACNPHPPIFLSRFAGDFTTWGCHGQNHNLGPESPSAIADTRLLSEPLVKSPGTVASADSEMPANEARNAIDGNPATLWHTPWGEGATAFPHSITVQLAQPHALRACTVLPRQDVEVNGMIKAYEVYASNDGRNWGKPVATGEFTADRELKRVVFPRPVTAKFVKLVALSGFDNQPFASIAEFDVEP